MILLRITHNLVIALAVAKWVAVP